MLHYLGRDCRHFMNNARVQPIIQLYKAFKNFAIMINFLKNNLQSLFINNNNYILFLILKALYFCFNCKKIKTNKLIAKYLNIEI